MSAEQLAGFHSTGNAPRALMILPLGNAPLSPQTRYSDIPGELNQNQTGVFKDYLKRVIHMMQIIAPPNVNYKFHSASILLHIEEVLLDIPLGERLIDSAVTTKHACRDCA